jgi:hypothetical protein
MADTRPPMQPARPQSIKELIAQAENYQFNPNVPFRYWTRAAETLYQEVWTPFRTAIPRTEQLTAS